jgi:hypothetical protein
MRTVRTTSSDDPRATRAARTVCDVPANCPPNHFPPKATGQPDRNEGAQEHAKNAKNTWAKPSTQTVREVQTGTGTVARKPTREHPTTYPSKDLPND